MLHRSGTVFDEAAALEELVSKYGVEEERGTKTESPTKKKRKPETDIKAEDDDKVGSPSSAVKKPKKTEIVAVEGNRAAAEAIKEMADIYFKNKDNRKGGKNYNSSVVLATLLRLTLYFHLYMFQYADCRCVFQGR